MIIQCSQGRVNADYCPRSGCPRPCPERAAHLRGRIERLRAYQKMLIDRHKSNPSSMYYEVIAATQDRIEHMKMLEKMNGAERT